jgi:hypothetical protein
MGTKSRSAFREYYKQLESDIQSFNRELITQAEQANREWTKKGGSFSAVMNPNIRNDMKQWYANVSSWKEQFDKELLSQSEARNIKATAEGKLNFGGGMDPKQRQAIIDGYKKFQQEVTEQEKQLARESAELQKKVQPIYGEGGSVTGVTGMDERYTKIKEGLNLLKGYKAEATKIREQIKTGIFPPDSNLETAKRALREVTNSFQTLNRELDGSKRGFRNYGIGIRGIINDFKDLIGWQVRWYAAKALIFTPLQAFASSFKQAVDFTTQIDDWTSQLIRFEASTGKVNNSVREDMKGVILAIRQAAIDVPVSFEEIAKSVESFIGAGVPADIVKAIVPDIAKLRTAYPEIDMKQFGVALTGTWNTFKDTLKDSGMAAEQFRLIFDKLLAAQAKGVIRPEQYTVVLQHMGEMAHMAGFSLDEFLALEIVVTNLGSKAGSASRSLRGMLQQMTSDKNIKNTFKQLGIDIDTDATLAKNFIPIMTQLRDKLNLEGDKGISVNSQNILGKLFGLERIKSVTTITRYLEDFIKFTKVIQESSGGTAAASAEMVQRVSGQIGLMKNRYAELSKAIWDSDGFVKGFYKTINDLLLGALLAVGDKAILAKHSIEELGIAGKIAYNSMGFLGVLSQEMGNDLKILASFFTPIITLLEKIQGAVGGVNFTFGVLIKLIMTSLISALVTKTLKLTAGAEAMAKLGTESLGLIPKIGLLGNALLAFAKKNAWLISLLTALQIVHSINAKISEPGDKTEAEESQKQLKIQNMSIEEAKKKRYQLLNDLDRTEWDAEELKKKIEKLEKITNGSFYRATEKVGSFIPGNSGNYESKVLASLKKEYNAKLITAAEYKKKLASLETPPPPGDSTGSGASLKDKTKTYYSERLAANREFHDAFRSIDRAEGDAELQALEELNKLKLISDDLYYAKRKELITSNTAKEIEDEKGKAKDALMIVLHNKGIAEEAAKEQANAFWDKFSGIMGSGERIESKIKTAQKALGDLLGESLVTRTGGKDAGTESEARTEKLAATLGKSFAVIFGLKAKSNTELKKLDNDEVLRNRNIEAEKIKHIATMEALNARQNVEATGSQIERQSEMNKYMYDKMLINSDTYYTFLEGKLKKQEELDTKAADSAIQEVVRQYNADYAMTKEGEEKRVQLENQFSVKMREYRQTLLMIDEKYLSERQKLFIEHEEDITTLYNGIGDLGKLFNRSLRDLKISFGTTGKQLYDVFTSIGQSMTIAFDTFFFDAMQGKLQSFRDYFLSFLSDVSKALSKFMAQKAVEGLLSMVPTSWFGTNTAGTGSTSTPGLTVSPNLAHSGGEVGYLPKFHTGGGLQPDESLIVGQKGEGVLSRRGMRNLDRLNNGSMDGQGMSVQVNIENKSSTEVKGSQGKVSFDGKGYVVGVILEDLNKNGPIRNAFKGLG